MNERVYVKSIYINVYIGCKIHPIYTTPGAIYTQPDARWTEYGDVCHKIWH